MSATRTSLWRLGALDLARAIRSGEVSSQEVIEAHVARIEAVNPDVNAITVVLGEQAREAAKAADRTAARGGDLPPFHGVPFTVKENIDLVGTPTTQGLKALADAYPTRDAPVVERLKAAGAIRSRAPTAPRARFAGIPRASCGEPPSIRGTDPGPPVPPAAARPWRWRPA